MTEHLCSIVPEQPEAWEDISVLLRAVLHGCEAGEYRHALDSTYRPRILQGPSYYHTTRFGAYGAGLSALMGFFEEPWERPVDRLNRWQRAFVIHEAAVHLMGLGRLEEALGPFEVAFSLYSKIPDLSHAALSGRDLTELHMTVGRLSEAISSEKALTYAAKALDPYEQMAEGSTLGRALFRFGRFSEAERAFLDAERFCEDGEVTQYRYSYFFWDFDFCELLISQGRYDEALERASRALRDIKLTDSKIATSQIHLAVGRGPLERGRPEDLATAADHIEPAVHGLQAAGHPLYLMDGRLGLALLRGRQGNATAVKAELDDAWDIAERAAMRLAMVDILLLRARLLDDHNAGAEAWQKITQ